MNIYSKLMRPPAALGSNWSELAKQAILLLAFCLPFPALAVDMLVSSFTDTPDPAVRGGLIVYQASITNNTTDTANNVSLVFTLDAQTSFVSVNDAACSYSAGTHKVTCSYATLAGDTNGPGTAQVKTVNVTMRSLAGAGTTIAAAATVSATNGDSNPANDTLNQITTIDNGADLSLLLSATPTSLPASSSLTYTAALQNAGPNAAGTVTATITLSPHLTYTSASGSGWTCGAAAQVVTCTRASAAIGALPDISIVAQETGAFTGTITTTGVVAISGSATDFNTANDSSTVDVTITNGTDLAISKTASASILGGGQAMSFTLLPRNLGPFSASNVSVSDTLPAGFTGINASGTGWTCNVAAQTLTCTRASYAVGATNDITVSAIAPVVGASTPYTNTTTISSATPDGVNSNNSGSVNVTVLPDGVDLAITKTKAPNPVAQGANMASTMRVTNNGPRAAASGEVKIVDTLPAGESFVALASGVNWTCGPQVGQTVTCTYNAALAVGAVTTDLVLSTTATAIGTLTNTACTNYTHASVTDPASANNCASASVTSTSGGTSIDLQVVKTANVAILAWNAPTITYTLTVTNAGPGVATGVTLSDPIPGFLAGSTTVNAALTGGTSTAGFTCSAGATVTCTQNSGSMVSGSTAIFTITVTRPLLDSSEQTGNLWTNTATVRSSNQGDTNLANNTSSATVQVDPVADIAVNSSVTPTSVQAGTPATWVLTVSNNGPSSASGVTLSEVFALNGGTMTFLSATPSIGTCAAFNPGTQTLNCSLGNMASGTTATVTIVMRPDYMVAPPSPRTVTGNVSVASTTQESNLANNTAQSVLAVNAAALDLLINNTDNVDPLGFAPASASPAFPDNVVTYNNTITNRGPSVASGLVLTYVMRPPTGKTMTFLGDKLAATGQAYSNYCNNLNTAVTGPATLTLTCTFPPSQILLSNNASTNLYLDFRVDTQPNVAGDAYTSTATISANEPEAINSNNSANQTTTIKMRVDLQMTKTARGFDGNADASINTVQLRQPFYWVVTLTNAGPGDSQVTRVIDTLPSNISLYTGGSIAPYNAAPYNSGVVWSTNNTAPTNGTCTNASGTLTCTIGLLESGKVAVIRVPVFANSFAIQTPQNCASATTSEVDPNVSNNTTICSAVTLQRSSIAGFVYLDSNNNAAKNGAEPGISGVTMTLNGVDIYGNTVSNLPQVTDATGFYIFANRSPGTYTVTETHPNAYLDGKETAGTVGGTATGATGDAISSIVLPANTQSTGYLFGEIQPASLSGFVFVDLNNNAQRDLTGVGATDESPGITSINLSLTGTDDLGPVNTNLTSGANGAYSFTNLRPGTYQVQQAVIPGVTHTGMTVGSKGGNDGATVVVANTPITGANKRTISNVVLASNDAATNYNFGESGQSLSGFVYIDLNNNGIKDGGEVGIAGVSVTLSGNTASNISVCVAISPNPCTITTDASGAYSFYGIPASDGTGYILTEQSQASTPLSNYADGIDSVGTVNAVPTGSMTNDRLAGIVIGLGQVGVNYNFGELAASLSGKVYLDVDQSNTNNGGDTNLAGVTVTLSGTSLNNVNVCTLIASCTATTDASGNFSFTGLPASNGAGYTLTETQPVDYAEASNSVGTGAATAGSASVAAGNSVFSGIVLNAGQNGINYLYGEKTGSISGFVYVDTNNNGNKDGAEVGIAGVTVTLTGTAAGGGTPCGTATCAATTLADGSYTFTNLTNANGAGYTITETQPGAYLDGITRKGTISNVSCAACVDNTPNVISAIPFVAANPHANFNFGELQVASIAGRVYLDINQDATYNAGEEMAGVTVTLSGIDDQNNAVNVVATTATDGTYSFTNLRPSNGAGYTVTETQATSVGDFAGNSGTQVGTIASVATGTAAQNVISAIVLVSGNAGVNYNFREKTASIAGTVYFDVNASNTLNAGDSRIAAVTITLSGAANRVTSSDAEGNFSFTGLLAGTYTLTQTQPSGYVDGTDAAGTAGGNVNAPKNAVTTIVIPAGFDATGYLFGEKRFVNEAGSLSGMVYVDLNNNGIWDSNELLLANVTLNLLGTDNEGRTVNLTVQTDSRGAYKFISVAPGTYTLSQTQPARYTDFVAATGTKIGTLAGGTAAKNSVSNIVMPSSGGDAVGYDFRELQVPAQIHGTVYLDSNRNGGRDTGEKGEIGIAAVNITLQGSDVYGNLVTRSVLTDAKGNFSFTGLNEGTYNLVQTQPANYQDGSDSAGNAGGTVNAPKNTISTIALISNQSASGYLFGEFLATDGMASLTGNVYLDANNNAKQDENEALAGISLSLTGVDVNGVALTARTVKTDANGRYVFDKLPAGTYQVEQTQPSEWGDFTGNSGSSLGTAGGKLDTAANKMSAIVLAANTQATLYDFREKPASLGGFVYRDDNHSGSKDTGEIGIANVVLILQQGSNEVARTSSNADGSFSFTGLPAGTYRVVQVQPSAYVDGIDSLGTIVGVSGADLGSVNNANFGNGAQFNTIEAIKLGAGQDGVNYLFGERRGSLSGFVYFDDNNNGSKDAVEKGIASVRVTLSGTPLDGSVLCQQVTCVATTGADGSYRFDNVPPGEYRLVETQTDMDTAKIVDGKETAGVAGGKVENSSYGTNPIYNTINGILITNQLLLAKNALIDGYLFGERVRTGPFLKPPIVNGYVWMDRNHTRVRPTDNQHEGVAGWTVTLTQNGKLICTATTDANGFYQFDNLACPGYEESGLPTGSGFEIKFSKDGNKLPNVATSGGSAGSVSGGTIRNISLNAGDEVTEQNLPLDPSGVVYDSVTRLPVAGAVVTFSGPPGYDPARHLLGGLDAVSQTTGTDGLYQFLLQNDFPEGTYRLTITTYPAGYLPQISSAIPSCVGNLNVGPTPTPGLVQKTNTAPGLGVALHNPNACQGMVQGGALTTQYYESFVITHLSAPILNNHIPLDPLQAAGFALSKTGDKAQIEIGETVGYTVLVKQTVGSPVPQVTVRDALPAGFRLVPGTVAVNGKPALDPIGVNGSVLVFNLGPMASGQQISLTYRARAGVGALQGDGINRAIAYSCRNATSCVNANSKTALPGATPSNQGQHKVKLVAGVFTEQACVAGKVFVDCNNNHIQDAEELGIPGVRLYLQNGTNFTTDIEGKFSHCGLPPKSHVLKVDSGTLPRGSRLTTTSNRNLGDANSLWLDLKNGELIRADFAEGSCSNSVLEQVKARRSQGGVRSVESEARQAGLKFESKPATAPRQATDSAKQTLVKPRQVVEVNDAK